MKEIRFIDVPIGTHLWKDGECYIKVAYGVAKHRRYKGPVLFKPKEIVYVKSTTI